MYYVIHTTHKQRKIEKNLQKDVSQMLSPRLQNTPVHGIANEELHDFPCVNLVWLFVGARLLEIGAMSRNSSAELLMP